MLKITTGTAVVLAGAAYLWWKSRQGETDPGTMDDLGMSDDEIAQTDMPDDLQTPPGEGDGTAGVNGAPIAGLRAPKPLMTYYGLGACAACSAAAKQKQRLNPFWGGPGKVMSRAYYG